MSAGVEIAGETGSAIREMCTRLWELSFDALNRGMDVYTDAPAYVEQKIHQYWPGRAYFIESEEDGRGVQVFQPWGIPKDHVAVPVDDKALPQVVIPNDRPAGATWNPPAPGMVVNLTPTTFDLTKKP